MDRSEAVDLIRQVRKIDEAEIYQANTQKPFSIQKITIDLGSAKLESDPYVLNFPFKSIYVEDATDTTSFVYLKPNSRDSLQSFLKLRQNDAPYFDEPISGCNLFWDAQAGKTITIVFMVAAQMRSGKLISVTNGGVAVTEGTSSTVSAVTLSATTATQVFAANTNRGCSYLYNNSTETVYVGGTNAVTDTTGYPISPGQEFSWRNTAVLYAYSIPGGEVRLLDQGL